MAGIDRQIIMVCLLSYPWLSVLQWLSPISFFLSAELSCNPFLSLSARQISGWRPIIVYQAELSLESHLSFGRIARICKLYQARIPC